MKYYAVRKGRQVGIFDDWETCRRLTAGFAGAEFKKFTSRADAETYMRREEALPEDTVFLREPPDADTAIAYVDGSYRLSDRSYAYGCVLLYRDTILRLSMRFPDGPDSCHRNVAGEIEGAKAAMRRAAHLGAKRLVIHHDYAGIRHWALGEWKQNLPLTRAYRAFCEALSDSMCLEFRKVPAHTGIPLNEEADRLAAEAVLGEEREQTQEKGR